ncbi:porin [Pseudoduganella namucuonensis]|uniref:Outer membrane protein (Porin) n=1 Tax=Pseudoduganella namucuonensis TaxID=1035707 RepID=A0A1I7L7L3_9BURK|nr:porin [Pseudoduganella namucuonensis]SFV05701.1 Outer membrane protein (porin) [Pseudoduganella namucuonensis]
MKQAIRNALALAAGLSASAAMAQSSVTVYGLVDTGLVYTTNINAAGDSITKMPSLTGSVPSRIGFRGTEDLGNGLQVFFTLENGLSLDTGTTGQGARLFGRQANVGLKGAWGTLTLGRQINMTFMSGFKSDVLGPNLFAIGSIDPYLPNARSDNAIGYLGNFSDFTVGATYSLGRDASAAGGPGATGCPGEVAGNSKACRQVTGLLGYDNKRFGVTASYDILYGNTGAAGGLTSSNNSDRRTTLNAYAMLGTAKLGGGVIDRKTNAVTGKTESDLYYLGVSFPASPLVTLDGQVAYRDTKGVNADVTMLVARATYHLSKRTAAYAAIGRMDNDGTSAVALDAGGTVGVGKAQNGLMAGLRHAF